MYCANCGVKLADTETVCPLCGITAFHPEIERKVAPKLYPAGQMKPQQVSSWGAMIVFTTVFLLPLLTVLIADVQMNRSVTWSGYVVGALLVCYVCFVLPFWFRRPNPVIFVPCGFGAVALYLLYISFATKGHWFLSFALPVTGGIGMITAAVVTLVRYVKRGKLYIFGGAIAALGVFMPVVEWLMVLTFSKISFIGWSVYPMVALVLLGGMLIFLAICRPARESMERKFFI